MKKTAAAIAVTSVLTLVLAACNSPAADKTDAPADAAPVTPQAAQQPSSAPVSAAEEEAAMAGRPSRAAFPVGFRGNWDYSDGGCAKDESGTRFVITENQIKGYEDTSTLTALESIDDLTVRVVLDNQSSDGDVTLTQTLRLSPVAGVTLRVEQNGQTVLAYRCDKV